MIPKHRSTFTPTNAKTFKGIFDKCIQEGKDVIVTIPPGRSPAAFRTKVSDALLYLVHFFDKEHIDETGKLHKEGDYARFKGLVTFKMRDNGDIHIANATNRILTKFASIDPMMYQGQAWKERVSSYLENPEMLNKPLNLKELFLSEDDQKFVRDSFEEYSRLTGHKVVLDVTATEIHGIKGEMK